MLYKFDWDINKANSNFIKHKIRFEEAITIFKDFNALTIYDDEHSDLEDRWITIGISNIGRLVIAVHTYIEMDEIAEIRIISARKATKKEKNNYNR